METLTHLYDGQVGWLRFWRRRPTLDPLKLVLKNEDPPLTARVVGSGN